MQMCVILFRVCARFGRLNLSMGRHISLRSCQTLKNEQNDDVRGKKGVKRIRGGVFKVKTHIKYKKGEE